MDKQKKLLPIGSYRGKLAKKIKEFHKELMLQNKSFCPIAFREIYTDNAGRHRLCCHAKFDPKFSKFSEEKTLPFDYFMSDEMEDIRQKMIEGEIIEACNTCRQIEEASGTSYRQKALRSYGITSDVENVALKVRSYGNYCNLACYMCHPQNSTERQKELDLVFPKSNLEDWNIFRKNELATVGKSKKYSDWEKYLEHILENIHLIDRFQMMGGETLQLPKFWEFLNAIPDEHANRIHVSSQSNLTEIRYKNQSIFDLADKFKNFYIGVSVDHFGEKLSFMRYPIDRKKFESNLYELSESGNIRFNINCTVSLLNIAEIHDIESYYENNFKLRYSVDFNNVVRGPRYLSIRNLPQTMKNEYIEKYKEYPYILAELKKPVYHSIDKFMTYCDKLSLHRSFDWRPLWKDFIDELQKES